MNNISHKNVSRSFSLSSKQYDKAAQLQRKVADRLLCKLSELSLSPKTILDAGCGTGYCTHLLSKKFESAKIVGIDIARGMIEIASRKIFNEASKEKIRFEIADMCALPYPDNHFDVVFSSLAVQWIKDPDSAFAELNRVLRPNGLLIFSSMGTNTLVELKRSWNKVDNQIHVNDFYDSKQLADQVSRSLFSEILFEQELLVMKFKEITGLMRNLKAIGAKNLNSNRTKGLQGREKFCRLAEEYENYRSSDGMLPATYDVIYCHAKKSTTKSFNHE